MGFIDLSLRERISGSLPAVRYLFRANANQIGELTLEQEIDRALRSIPLGMPGRLQERVRYQFLATEITDPTILGKILGRLGRQPITLGSLLLRIPAASELERWIVDGSKAMQLTRTVDIKLGRLIRQAKTTKAFGEDQLDYLERFQAQLEAVIVKRHGTISPEIIKIEKDNPAHNNPEFLEQIVNQEAVHRFGVIGDKWEDLYRRLGWEGKGAEHRAIYAKLDPYDSTGIMMSIQAVFFDHKNLPDNIGTVLNGENVVNGEPDSVAFVSISSGKKVRQSFGANFIRAVAAEIHKTRPGIKNFYTLSPMPEFREWVDQTLNEGVWKSLGGDEFMGMTLSQLRDELSKVSSNKELRANAGLYDCMQHLAFAYLTGGTTNSRGEFRGYDGVAGGVHLAGGAEIARINFEGSDYDYMWEKSYGFMVNYCYKVVFDNVVSIDRLERNIARYKTGTTHLTADMAPFVGNLNARAPCGTKWFIQDPVPRLIAA